MSDENNLVRFHIKIRPEIYAYYKARAKQTGVAMSSLMHLALERSAKEEVELQKQFDEVMAEIKKKQEEEEV